MKKKLLFILLFIVLFTLLAGCDSDTKENDFADSIITVDINPSIELTTDKKGLISSVKTINKEAQDVLLDVDLTGLVVEEGFKKIVEFASKAGYLEYEYDNTILITVFKKGISKNIKKYEKTIDELLTKYLRDNYYYGEIIVENVDTNDEDIEELVDEAFTIKKSIGRLRQYKRIISKKPDKTIDDLLDLSVKELQEILITLDGKDKQEEMLRVKEREKEFNKWVEEKEERKEEFENRKYETSKRLTFANSIIIVDLDISIEITTNKNGLIENVKLISKETQDVLLDRDLTGLVVDEGFKEIIEYACKEGYLEYEFDNTILITVFKKGNYQDEVLERYIKERLRKNLRDNFYYGDIIVENVDTNDEDIEVLLDEAFTIKKSIGRLRQYKRIISKKPDKTIDDLLDLSIGELKEILITLDGKDGQDELLKAKERKEQFNKWVEEETERQEEFELKKQERNKQTGKK